MPGVGEPVNFTWNVRTAFIGRILVIRSGGGTVHSVHDQTYPALPTSASGTFFDNPGAGTWLYILIYTASLDPDVAEEFYEVVDSVTVVWPTEDTTDGSWSFLRQRNPPASEDGDWSQIEPSPVPPTIDSNWSSLRSTVPTAAPTIDGGWSLIRSVAADGSTTDSPWTLLHRIGPTNSPPEWDLPSAINVVINDTIIINLLDYCSDPDGDSLTFAATENSSFFSINLSGSMLTINGGTNDRRPAGIISLTASDGQASVPASVPVNVLDFSINAAPIIITPIAPSSPVIIDGRGTGGGRVFATNQYTATDSDGDTIPTWDADPPGGWRVENDDSLSTSTIPNAHQVGFVQLSAIQDYFHRSTIYSNSVVPASAIWSVRYRVRCRDNRRAWSNYEDSEISVLQPVHGSNEDVDSFEERPDRRQPNIWAFKKGATTSISLGGVSYQYTTPDAARA